MPGIIYKSFIVYFQNEFLLLFIKLNFQNVLLYRILEKVQFFFHILLEIFFYFLVILIYEHSIFPRKYWELKSNCVFRFLNKKLPHILYFAVSIISSNPFHLWILNSYSLHYTWFKMRLWKLFIYLFSKNFLKNNSLDLLISLAFLFLSVNNEFLVLNNSSLLKMCGIFINLVFLDVSLSFLLFRLFQVDGGNYLI